MRQGQTAKAFLPASNALSSLKSVTATPRGLVCRTSSPSFFLGLAVGGRVRLSPSTVRPFAANGPRVRGHSRFSPAAYGPHAGHLSVQHFTLHQPEQGRQGLSFVVEGAAAYRPFRHPISGMSSFAQHSASSIAFHSRMGESTGGIALGSLHDSVRLHTSVWEKSPSPPLRCFDTSMLRAAATTLRLYIAAIAAQRVLDEIPLGRHRMDSAFMRGVRRLRPVRPTAVPSWDLSVILEGLVMAPFEPLESASERILTLKVTLLLALMSLKRVGDLQAFSVSETCMDFVPGLVKVTLRPRPGYIPKVLSTSFRSQVVTLHSFHPPPFASSEDERLHMLCPVRALKLYVEHSKVWRKSSQLLVCFGAGRRGLATSKQRISHWVRDAISLAYEARNFPSPLSLRAHSTRGVASSQALFRGVPLEDICVAAGWSSPHTFVKFYNLDLDTAPGPQILSV